MTYLDPVLPKNKSANYPIDITNSPLQQNFVLSEREAEAASPESMAVCGEEDPGESLEFLVTKDIDDPKQ